MIDSEQRLIDMLIEAKALTHEQLADGERLQEASGGSRRSCLFRRRVVVHLRAQVGEADFRPDFRPRGNVAEPIGLCARSPLKWSPFL